MERKTDVVVIGGGITGTAILAALARLDLSCVLAEKEPDIAAGRRRRTARSCTRVLTRLRAV